MTTWNNGCVHDQLEPGSPQERLGTRLYYQCEAGVMWALTLLAMVHGLTFVGEVPWMQTIETVAFSTN